MSCVTMCLRSRTGNVAFVGNIVTLRCEQMGWFNEDEAYQIIEISPDGLVRFNNGAIQPAEGIIDFNVIG